MLTRYAPLVSFSVLCLSLSALVYVSACLSMPSHEFVRVNAVVCVRVLGSDGGRGLPLKHFFEASPI